MPWDPTFWIRAQDYKRILPELAELHSEDILQAFEFKFLDADGFVIAPYADVTRHHVQLHDLFMEKNVEHWIIDGEGSEHTCCHQWGAEHDIEMDAILERTEQKGG